MNLAPLLKKLPASFEIVLADVGAAGGLHPRWKAARSVVSALQFEPREGDEVRKAGRDLTFSIGLGPSAGTEELNVTALPNMSSTLRPNSLLLASYAKKPAHTRIVDRRTIRVDSLDAIARTKDLRVDALKVDTQGSELGILQGARECLRQSVILAEVEVSFFQRYEGQAVFRDVAGFMEEHGFDLIDLYRLKRYRRANSAGIGNMSMGRGQRAGRLAYGDAIFFLKEDILLDRIGQATPAEAERIALCAILAMLIYGKPDMAAHMFEVTSSALGESLRACLGEWFGSLGKGPFRAGVWHHVADYIARRV